MLSQALFAYFHYLVLFITIGALCMELVLYAPPFDVKRARRLVWTDAAYGMAAVLVAVTGFSRALWFGKGTAFYFPNPLFWTKVALFAVWALVSLVPTFHYLSWTKDLKEDRAPEVTPAQRKKIRRCLIIQLHLAMVIPILAVLMARGYGLAPQ